jgi:uncharacterized protein HemY
MGFLGYCAPVRVPIYFLQALPDSEQAVAVLAELSLIRHDPFEDGVPAVSVHRLVQAVARHRAEAKDAAEAMIERVTEALSMPPPARPHGLFRALGELIPRLRVFSHQRQLFRHQLEHTARKYAHLADRYANAADRCDAAGDPEKARKLRDKAAELRENGSRLRKIKFGGR